MQLEQKQPIIEIPPESNITLKALMTAEIFIAAFLPIIGFAIIGWKAAGSIKTEEAPVFVLIFILVAILTFGSEILLITYLHRAMHQRFQHMITVCQEFATGHHHVRVAIDDDSETRAVSRAVNTLLDHLAIKLENVASGMITSRAHTGTLAPPPPIPTPIVQMPVPEQPSQESQKELASIRNELLLTDRQIKQLIHEINPVLDGNLKIKASPARGNLGVLSEICNYLVEEIVQLARWTRFAAEQVVDQSHTLLDRAVKLAHTTESQMQQLAETTIVIEKTVAFSQRLGSSIQLSIDIAQEVRTQVQGSFSPLTSQIDSEIQRQIQLLSNLLASSQQQSDDAEGTLARLYGFARQTHEASTAILSAAERISTLATLAEQWRGSVESLQLPAERQESGPIPQQKALPPARK